MKPRTGQKGLVALVATLVLAMLGCNPEGYLPLATSGAIGCPPAEIKVHNIESYLGLRAWQAQCRGREFQCSNTGSDISCTELISPPNSTNGPMPGVTAWQAPPPGAPPPAPAPPAQ